MGQRKGGVIFFKVDGTQYQAKGNFSYGLGKEVREAIVGSDTVHGFKGMPTAPFIEGEITDSADLSLDSFSAITDSTVTLELANGKVIALRNAWSCNADGLKVQTEEGNVAIRFEGISAEEVR